jgi:hypothetical protein
MKGKVKYSFEIFLEFELVKETVDRLFSNIIGLIFINLVASFYCDNRQYEAVAAVNA